MFLLSVGILFFVTSTLTGEVVLRCDYNLHFLGTKVSEHLFKSAEVIRGVFMCLFIFFAIAFSLP